MFNWNLLRLPAETNFQVPRTWSVQRVASDLLTRLPTMAANDQYDVRFALVKAADWPELGEEGRHAVSQRLNLHAIVACWGFSGWPTAIASSAAVSAALAMLLLPPEIAPVLRGGNNVRGRRHQQDQPRNNRQPQQTPAPAQPPAQPHRQNRRGRGGRRANGVTSSYPAFWIWITYSSCFVHLQNLIVSLPFP